MTMYLPVEQYFGQHKFFVSADADPLLELEFNSALVSFTIESNVDDGGWVAPDEGLVQAVLDAMEALALQLASTGSSLGGSSHSWLENHSESV